MLFSVSAGAVYNFTHNIPRPYLQNVPRLLCIGLWLKENIMTFSSFFQDLVKRTPSTSAIYETLRRSKELRESLSRPGSRLSIDNIPEKLKEPVSIKVLLANWRCLFLFSFLSLRGHDARDNQRKFHWNLLLESLAFLDIPVTGSFINKFTSEKVKLTKQN